MSLSKFSAIVFQYRITCQKEAVFMEFKIVCGTYIRLFCSHFQAMQFHSLIKINVLSVTYKFRDETKEKPTLIATWKRNWCLKYCLHTAHVWVWVWVSVNVMKRSNYTGRQKKKKLNPFYNSESDGKLYNFQLIDTVSKGFVCICACKVFINCLWKCHRILYHRECL